jgi:L-threonylcarbamoyladenylate synthase
LLSRQTHVLRAAEVLRTGGLVILPTDTVYGVACDPDNVEAMARLYRAKGRGEEKPLQLLLAEPGWLNQVSEGLSAEAKRLAEAFFPGGITLVVNKVGGGTVGVRVPDHPTCLEVIRAFGRPIAASSANRSGEPSPRTADEAIAQLGDRIDLVVDSGPCPVGRDSTVIDATRTPVSVLREGAVSRDEIDRVLGHPAPLRDSSLRSE